MTPKPHSPSEADQVFGPTDISLRDIEVALLLPSTENLDRGFVNLLLGLRRPYRRVNRDDGLRVRDTTQHGWRTYGGNSTDTGNIPDQVIPSGSWLLFTESEAGTGFQCRTFHQGEIFAWTHPNVDGGKPQILWDSPTLHIEVKNGVRLRGGNFFRDLGFTEREYNITLELFEFSSRTMKASKLDAMGVTHEELNALAIKYVAHQDYFDEVLLDIFKDEIVEISKQPKPAVFEVPMAPSVPLDTPFENLGIPSFNQWKEMGSPSGSYKNYLIMDLDIDPDDALGMME
jgi:hypothetical protein